MGGRQARRISSTLDNDRTGGHVHIAPKPIKTAQPKERAARGARTVSVRSAWKDLKPPKLAIHAFFILLSPFAGARLCAKRQPQQHSSCRRSRSTAPNSL